jgi:hypothetical protein
MQEMTDFFKGLNFDRIDSFRLNRLNTISCTQKFNKFEIIDKNGNQLPNGILDNNNNLNPTAELVTSTKDFEIVNKLKNLFTISTDVPVSFEIPLFKTALLFYSNDTLIKGINISFRQGMFHSTTNEILSLSENDFEIFRLFFYVDLKHELYETANYFGSIGDNWQKHSFPNSFYYNPQWKSYESSIQTSIICQNYDRVRLEIETNGKNISSIQLRRIFYVMNYPLELRNKMNEMILEYYNQMTNNYSLPKLNVEEIDNLKYFVKLVGVTIYENAESDILLSFKNWDEEHGLHININETNQKIEFAF